MPRSPIVSTPYYLNLTVAKLLDGAEYDRRGSAEHPFGFVYFQQGNYDGQETRVGYIGNVAKPEALDDPTAHPTDRYSPYVFTANWGEPTYYHIIAAWDLLVEEKIGAFPAAAAAEPDVVRWMNGGDFIPADRDLLETSAKREQTAAKRNFKKAQQGGLMVHYSAEAPTSEPGVVAHPACRPLGEFGVGFAAVSDPTGVTCPDCRASLR